MAISSGFLIIGSLMTLAGAILIYMSLKAGPHEVSRRDGVVFIGPVPIMVEGLRRWIIAALGITGIILAWLVSSTLKLSILGWF